MEAPEPRGYSLRRCPCQAGEQPSSAAVQWKPEETPELVFAIHHGRILFSWKLLCLRGLYLTASLAGTPEVR